jgi:hypothetical protein
MANVDVYVWHDEHGNITAAGHVPAGSTKKIRALAHWDRRVIKLSIAQDYLKTLHVTHKIDVAKGALMPRKA